jgi:ABC-2 type transport system permease protein
MNKINLIIAREYTTRVRKKSFIVMTILGPILFASIIILPAFLSQVEDQSPRKIAVVELDAYGNPVPDSLQFFRGIIPDKDNMKFVYMDNMRLDEMLRLYKASDYDGVLYLPQTLISAGSSAHVEFYYRHSPGVSLENHITSSIEKHLFNNKLLVEKIPADVVNSLETNISLNRINWEYWPEKRADATDIKRVIGMVVGILIYFFIFFFGAQIMRGVIEEKSSRIVEVIVSSVTPFQLMMGKIIGVGLTGLTQFIIWILLTFGISTFVQQFVLSDAPVKVTQLAPSNVMDPSLPQVSENTEQNAQVLNDVMGQLSAVNLPLIIGGFIFFFLGGYLLYGSLFAAIGAAADSETDTQQFMLPLTIPLIVGMFVMINSTMNPFSRLAVIFSIIPLTSPIVMMGRIPFGVPFVELASSMLLLVLTFIGTTWLAGKIYRTGILMYGKKVNYSELWKWLRYRD